MNRDRTLTKLFGVVAGLCLGGCTAMPLSQTPDLESAESYLNRHDVPTSTVRALSDTPVTIVSKREADIAAFDQALRETQSQDDILTDDRRKGYITKARTQKLAFAVRTPTTPAQCYVFPMAKDISAKRYFSMATKIEANQLENVPLSDKEAFILSLLHEIRHCDSGNSALPYPLIEAEADAQAAWTTAKIFNKPEIIKARIYMRILGSDLIHKGSPSHRTALYMNAKLHGEPLPNAEDIDNAWDEAQAMAWLYHDDNDRKTPDLIKTTNACRKALAQTEYEITNPLARRLLELQIEAATYFVPKAVASSQKPMTVSP